MKPAAWMCSTCFHRSSVNESPHDSGSPEDCMATMQPLFTRDDLVAVGEQVKEALVDADDWNGIPVRIVDEMLREGEG